MTLRVPSTVWAAGSDKTPNEDTYGHVAGTAWVLDGATGLGRRLLPGEPSDAAWFARTCGDFLSRSSSESPALPLKELVQGLVEYVGHAFEEALRQASQPSAASAEPHERPSAGLALVRLRGNGLEYGILGDCCVILPPSASYPDGTVRPKQLTLFDQKVIDKMRQLVESGQAPDPAKARETDSVRRMLWTNRGLMNQESGYWVLSTQVNAAAQIARNMITGTVPLTPGVPAAGLLVTDGFFRLVDTVRSAAMPDGAALLKAARRPEGLDGLLRDLRAAEDDDPRWKKYPRLKLKDDATALLFEALAAG